MTSAIPRQAPPGAGDPLASGAGPARWRSLGAVAAAAIGPLAPLAVAWASGLTVLHRDQTGQYAPLRWLAGTALRSFRLPLWNPYCAAGMPYLAETTHGVLHPLSVAAAYLFPSDGLDPLVGLWIASAALGAFALARSLGTSTAASLVAACAFGLSGFTLSSTSNLIGVAGAGSAPWILAGLRVAGRDGDARGLLCGAAAVAAGALAGDVQTLAVASLVGLALALEAGGGRGALLGLGAVAAGALLAGIQLVPSWHFLHQTDRALALPRWEHDQWDLAPWRLVELVSPGFFTVPSDGMGPAPVYLALGHPTGYTLPMSESVFVGAAVLLLAAAGARASRTGATLLGAALVVTWLAMGRHLGARSIQDLLPIASGWRYGEKYQPVAVLCAAALAALGADRLARDARRARRFAVLAVAVAAAVAGTCLALVPGEEGGVLARLGAPSAGVAREHLVAGLPHAAIALLAAAACLWLAARGRSAAAVAGLAAVVWGAGIAASPYALRPGSRAARLDAPAPALHADPPGPRVLRAGNTPPRPPHAGWDAIDERNFDVGTTYVPNANASRRVDAFGVDSGLTPVRWALLGQALGPRIQLAARRYAVTHLVLPPDGAPGLDAAGRARALEGATLELADSRTGMSFWAIPHRGWAGFPQEVVPAPTPEAALDAVVELERTGRRATVIEADGNIPTAPGRVLEVRRGREEVEIVAEAAGEAVLVVNDAWWPGWRARVDGREVPVLPADFLVRAIPFPAGRHTLVMRYEPPEVLHGAALSAAGAAALAAAALALSRRSRRERIPSPPARARGKGEPLTVVLPVWNEGANLPDWWRGAAPHLPPGTRVLVVHDRDDDDTVPVARALAAAGAPLHLVRNEGAGFPDALRTGLLAAGRGPVLVAMADLADDLAALPRMLAAWRDGADVVVGSRYMPGGRHVGADRTKAALGRWGSAALFRVAGFPVRDATNAFRLYDAEAYRRLDVPPCAGFEVALATLVAAWRAGARIVEVPVSWTARKRGESRFRVRWLPRYGRLWLGALAAGLAGRRRRGEAG